MIRDWLSPFLGFNFISVAIQTIANLFGRYRRFISGIHPRQVSSGKVRSVQALCAAGGVAVSLMPAVVAATLRNRYLVTLHTVNQPVSVIDASRPVTGQVASQWFRLAGSGEWMPLDFLNHGVNSPRHGLVSLLPIKVTVPCDLVESNLHRVAIPVRQCFCRAEYPQCTF